jgi:glutamyl-tRNA reductase
MLNGLKLWNFSAGTLPPEELCGSTFVLRTCQRTLVLTFERHPFHHTHVAPHTLLEGGAAYLFLLETICGLQSKLIGENEIVGQFKEAYKIYAQSTLKDTRLLQILEKLFKDAKDIRTQHLIGISQKTYASLTRKHLIQKARAPHVVIVGSGALAEDLINQFKKKAKVSLCARNGERVQALANQHQLAVISWDKRDELSDEPFIANTVGHESVLFDEAFFTAWSQKHPERLFVDLGSPSVIRTSLELEDGVVRLADIFNEGAVVEGQKQQQIALAREAMRAVTEKRQALFAQKLFTPQLPAKVLTSAGGNSL